MPKCKIEWCKRRVFHKRLGLCGPHYQQAYQDAKQRRVPIEQGKPRVDVPLRGSLRGVAVCTQLGCDRCVWHEKTQLCEHHYWRNRRHGDPSHMERPRDRKCTVIECGALCPRKHKGHGLCKMHLDRNAPMQCDAAYRLSKAILWRCWSCAIRCAAARSKAARDHLMGRIMAENFAISIITVITVVRR
jgi:hypothetical protein